MRRSTVAAGARFDRLGCWGTTSRGAARCPTRKPSASRSATGSGRRWTSLAIAAAVVLTFVAGYLVGRGREVATSFDAVWVTSATGSEAAAELLATHRAPDPSALFAAMFAN